MERRRSHPVTKFRSLDSWFQKNTSYWRKTSTPAHFSLRESVNVRQPQIPNTSGLEMEEQFLHYDEAIIVPANSNRPINSDSDSNDSTQSNAGSFDTYSCATSTDPGLDNCCSLDIVTVRNESVVAKNLEAIKSRVQGSDGYETASSLGSGSDEAKPFESQNQPMTSTELFIPGDFEQRLPQQLTRSRSCCPFCGEVINLTNFDLPRRAQSDLRVTEVIEKPKFTSLVSNLEENEDQEDEVINAEEEVEVTNTATLPPYYVRLRQNLFFPTVNSLHLKSPKNFSVDRKGQLLIDYTANWDGLEKYIETLKR